MPCLIMNPTNRYERNKIMITEDVTLRNISAEIDESEIDIINAYPQGAVYSWCKNSKDENQNQN